MTNGISIIIPAVNEASIIARAVLQFTQHTYSSFLEVIVVDGGSQDRTVEIAAGAGAKVVESPKRNRAAQMNLGARSAKFPVLYFVHADVQVPKSFYDDIFLSINQGFESGCYRSDFESYPGLMRVNAYMTRFNLLTCRGGDQTLFITKSSFDKLNGFDEHYTIMEDYDFIARLWKAKIPFELIQKDVAISVRKYQKNSWLRVQIANGIAMFLFKQKKSPEVIKRYYRKLLNYREENYQPPS
jgi:rSAM/selenodomain-associated transferase 2